MEEDLGTRLDPSGVLLNVNISFIMNGRLFSTVICVNCSLRPRHSLDLQHGEVLKVMTSWMGT